MSHPILSAGPVGTPVNQGNKNAHLIADLRASARLLVREFGFMSTTFAGTNLPSSAVHAIIEIGAADAAIDGKEAGCSSAAALCTELNLEKSSVSRMLKKLIKSGEVEENISEKDSRGKTLSLTAKGRKTLEMVNVYGNIQVEEALARLTKGVTAEMVLKGVGTYANALRSVRLGGPKTEEDKVEIIEGYRPGLIGRVIDLNMEYYHRALNFGAPFEAMITTGLADLVTRLDGTRAQVWCALLGDRILGCVFIDAESGEIESSNGLAVTHFRFFIVDESLQGKGIGKILVERAMKWVDERSSECQLWTFGELVHARKLYDRAGFKLAEEVKSGGPTSWGKEFWVHQRFVRAQRTPEPASISKFVF